MINVTILKPTRGKYYKARWTDPETGQRRERSTKTTKQREAERFAARLEKELQDGTYSDPSAVKWSDFRDRYETEVLPGLSENTAVKRISVFDIVEAAIDPRLLRQVNAASLARLVAQLRENERSEATIGGYLAHLRSALNWAYRMGMIPKKIELTMPKKVEGMKGRPIKLEEHERMLAAVFEVVEGRKRKPDEPDTDRVLSWKFLLNGLWWSGLRIDEANRLHWTDQSGFCIEFTGKHPKFRIQATAQKGRRFELLPMAPEFFEQLQTIAQDEREGFVFNPTSRRPGRYPGRMTTDRISRVITDIAAKANVKTGTRKKHSKKGEKSEDVPQFAGAHDYRRAFGTRWASRVPAHILQRMMRHANIETTLKYYVEQDADSASDIIWAAHRETLPRESQAVDVPASDIKSSRCVPSPRCF